MKAFTLFVMYFNYYVVFYGYFYITKMLHYMENSAPQKKKKHTAGERIISAYPTPYYHKLTKAFVHSREEKTASFISKLIASFFDEMEPTERDRLMNYHSEVLANPGLSR